MTNDIDDRLAAAGRRWRAEQPAPPPADQSWFAASKQTRVRPARWAPLAAAAAIAVLVAGVGVVQYTRREPAPATAAAQDPLALIGLWRIAGVDAEPVSVVGFYNGDVKLWQPCGEIDGVWKAGTSGLFIAQISGYRADCGIGVGDRSLAWLNGAVAFRVDGDTRVLLGADGDPLARLLPHGEPTPDPRLTFERPVVTDEMRRWLAPAAPLPPGVVPASREALLGRWLAVAPPVQWRRQEPYIELDSGETWRGSDGCNILGGRWLSGAAGALLTISRGQTDMFCQNIDVGHWLGQARRAGMDGDELVLFDATGTELGRFHR
jgi:META domain